MPVVKRKYAKAKPMPELELLTQWLFGELDDNLEAIRECRGELYFLDQHYVEELWAELRSQLMRRWAKDPQRFAEQISDLWVHGIITTQDVNQLRGEL